MLRAAQQSGQPQGAALGYNPRSRSFREASKKLEFVALCIIGTVGRVRRAWDDNEGAQPIRLVVTAGDPKDSVKPYNRGVHSHDGLYVLHAYVYLESEYHAARVKEWIEGKAGEELLFGWKDAEPWVFELLVGDAVRALNFEAFDRGERDRRIAAAARNGR